jgi:thiosulfate/3-mercaptopyruvate sulfurtransferase
MLGQTLIEPLALIRADWLVLDARDEQEYGTGHWPAAPHVPIPQWEAAARTAATDLANDAHWHTLIGDLGIDGSQPVAIYDDGRMTEAARVWFILQHFGVAAAVVDGGWPLMSCRQTPHVFGHAQSLSRAPARQALSVS